VENLSVEEAVKRIYIYLKRDNFSPYFVVSDGASECAKLKNFFGEFELIYISSFCRENYFLDFDLFVERLNRLENDAICYGLGEYIYFTGQENILRFLQDKTFNRKIIFVCRGVANLLKKLADEDLKFRENRLCKIGGKANFSVVRYSENIKISTTDAKNFSELLRLVESGKSDLTVQSDLPLLNVKAINNFHDAIKIREPNFAISPAALNENQWREYSFDDKCEGYPPEHWRSFAAGFKHKIANPYLKFVFKMSATYEDYRRNLLFALLEISDENFEEFYALRKAAVKDISEEYLARLEGDSEAVKYLTDNTAEERRAMIRAVQGKEKIPTIFEKNYAAMKDYLADYDFDDAELTIYFRRYKRIKLCNIDDANFKNHVREIALTRPYNKFYTRQKLLDEANKNSKLYWSDALGVEFLSYIEAQAKRLGLCTTIKIARAELPTLTSQNKNFYDEWRGDKFDKNSKLDDLKHAPEIFDAAGKCSAPIYIDDELKIIEDTLAKIKSWLNKNAGRKVLLTSDHGASRLAVMYGRENKFKLKTSGEHGGRCCPKNSFDKKPPCAIEENDWWVSANYDRFAGGRLSSVEVHGGATLEEILVPVIEFSLQANAADKISYAKKIPAPLKEVDDGFDFFE
jgi:hypothetical protein